MERERKRERKKRREVKTKARVRAAQLAQSEGIAEEAFAPGEQLFSLTAIRSRGAAGSMADAQAPDSTDDGSSGGEGAGGGGSGSELDTEEEQRRWVVASVACGRLSCPLAGPHACSPPLTSPPLSPLQPPTCQWPAANGDNDQDLNEAPLAHRRYDAVMDEYLEESYQAYKIRQRVRDAGGPPKKRRRRLGMGGELDDEGEEEGGGDADADGLPSSSSSSEDEEEEEVSGRAGGRALACPRLRALGACGPAGAWLHWACSLQQQQQQQQQHGPLLACGGRRVLRLLAGRVEPVAAAVPTPALFTLLCCLLCANRRRAVA